MLHSVVLMRTFVFMISNTAKENEKYEQVPLFKEKYNVPDQRHSV